MNSDTFHKIVQENKFKTFFIKHNRPTKIKDKKIIYNFLYELFYYVNKNDKLKNKLLTLSTSNGNNTETTDFLIKRIDYYNKKRTCIICKQPFYFKNEVGQFRCYRKLKVNHWKGIYRECIHHDSETRNQGIIHIPIIMILWDYVKNIIQTENVVSLFVVPLKNSGIIDVNSSFISVNSIKQNYE